MQHHDFRSFFAIPALAVAACSGSSKNDKPPVTVEPLAGADRCADAPLLSLEHGTVAVTSTMPPGDDGTTAACGLATAADVFFRVHLTEDARVTALVAADTPVSVALLADGCDALTPVVACAGASHETLAAGSYLVAVTAPAGTKYTLTMASRPPTPTPPVVPGADTCDAPPSLSLAAGAVSVSGSLPSAAATGASPCGAATADEPWAARWFRIRADALSDVGLLAYSSAAVRVVLLSDVCPAGEAASACAAAVTSTVAGGTYLIAVVGPPDAAFDLTVVAFPRAVGGDDCDAPPALSLATGAAVVSGTIPDGNHGVAVACGDPAQPDVFFRVRVPSEANLSYVLEGDEAARVVLLADSCPVGALAGACSRSATQHVTAGTYLLGVYGPAGAAYTLTLTQTLVPVPPPPPPVAGSSCELPLTLTLANGSNLLSGSFEAATDSSAGSCENTSRPDIVYRLTLTAPADLVISMSSPYHLRAVSCEGTEVACSDYGSVYVANQPAGTYDLFLSKQYSSTYSGTVQVLPPSPQPTNDSPQTPQPLTFVSGVATATGKLVSAAPEATSTCGGKRALYYSFELSSPTAIKLAVDSPSVGVQLSGPATGALFCDTYGSRCTDVLAAGSYTVRLSEYFGTVTTPVTLAVTHLTAEAAPANDTCDTATPLVLNGTSASATGTVLAANNSVTLTGDNCDPVLSSGGKDVFYRLTLAEKSDVAVTLSASSGLQLSVLDTPCGGGAGRCAGAWYSSSIRLYGVSPGDLTIVVESMSSNASFNGCTSSSSGAFSLAATVTPSPVAPANDTCANATALDLGTAGTAVSVAGTTKGATNDLASVLCPGSSTPVQMGGPDVVYALTLATPGRIRVTPTSSAGSMALYLMGIACPGTAAMVCSSTQTSGAAIDTGFALPAGTYYLAVDQSSYYDDPVPGDFSLVIEHLSP